MNALRVMIPTSLGVVALLVAPDRGEAATNEFLGLTNDYSLFFNWSLGHVPDDGEDVLIPSGKTCNVDEDSDLLNTLTVETGAVIEIEDYNRLRFGADLDQVSTIDGTVYINICNTASDDGLLYTAPHTLNGDGKIIGNDDTSHIQIANTLFTLTCNVVIEGGMVINGSGTFLLSAGTINANAGRTIHVNTDTVNDTSGGTWRVSSSSSTLRWDQNTGTSATALDGDFIVEAGTLDIDYPAFTTTGTLTWTGGTINCVDAGNDVTMTGS